MTKNIEIIFKQNIEILSCLDKTILGFQMQNHYAALNYCSGLINLLSSNMNHIIEEKDYFNRDSVIFDQAGIDPILAGLLKAQEDRDYILLADILELQLKPFILSLQEAVVSKEKLIYDDNQYQNCLELMQKKNAELADILKHCLSPLQILDNGYYVEFTSSGLKTLAMNDENGVKYYYHSNADALHEAGMIAREWFQDNQSEYYIYGLGFGYHISELLELDDQIDIHVYESDLKIIQLACAFGYMDKLLDSDRVDIIYDPDFKQLNADINPLGEDSKFVIYYPALRNISNRYIREKLEDYFISSSSITNQLHKLNNNFKKNVQDDVESVDVLKEKFYKKDLYIIAAGPSLDRNFMELKNVSKNSIILATGTVLKKLLSAGIRPDYVIITDANKAVYKQIEGLKCNEIPLIYLSTVFHKVYADYRGEKYLVCQKEFRMAEEYAEKMGYHLYQTGGSVMTTAIDIGIQLECQRIICVGLDLAYTNNFDHACGTANANSISSNGLRYVKDVYGNMVGTSKNLDIYRKWIENRIHDVKNIEFIDATEGGAKIDGMKTMKLSDCIRTRD